MKKINIGIVGAGFAGQQHIEAIRRIPGTRVVALCDPNKMLLERTGAELCIEHCYADFEEMAASHKLDVVHICTPNNSHCRISSYFIKRGINIYCEKPLANKVKEGVALCAQAKEYGVLAGVNFNYRSNAVVREMRERIQAKEWGKTLLVHGKYLQDWMMYDSDYNWRCTPEIGGVSRTVADIGSHFFDTVQFIADKRIVRVYAKLITVINKRKKPKEATMTFEQLSDEESGFEMIEMNSEDAAVVIFEFEDGVVGQLGLSQVSAGHKNDFEVNFDGSSNAISWNQENADKLVVSDRKQGKLMIYSAPDALCENAARFATLPAGHPVGWADALRNSIAEFYRALRGEKKACYATFEDGCYILKIVEACLESNKTGRWVEVEEMR